MAIALYRSLVYIAASTIIRYERVRQTETERGREREREKERERE